MIDIFTKLGYAISYDTMKRFDVDIAHMITEKAGGNRCPVSDTIKSDNPIMGAIDNFNHKERTNTGGDTADDTVLLIMQNDENISLTITKEIKHLVCAELLKLWIEGETWKQLFHARSSSCHD